jgi:hypothetical protein
MKKIIISFFAICLIAGCTPPTEEIDVAKEEEAIKALIKKEISVYLERDYISQSDIWKKEDYVRKVENFGNNHNYIVGWDSINADHKIHSEREFWSDVTNIKGESKDFNIKVYDKVAWAVFYQQWTGEYKGEPIDNTQSRVYFLEKVDENWKIVLMTMTLLNPCETEDEDEDDDE